MKFQASVVTHRFVSSPNELLVTVGIEDEGMKSAEIVELRVIIEGSEEDLKSLSFAEIESLAIRRAKEILNLG